MSTVPDASAPQTAAEAEEVEVGNRWSAVAHVFFGLLFLLASLSVVYTSHSESISKSADFVRLYTYSKSAPDKSQVTAKLRDYLSTDAGTWINSQSSQCNDLTSFWFPSYTWGTGAGQNPIVAGSCDFQVELKLGPMEGQLQIARVVPVVTTGCAEGQYTPLWSQSSGTFTGAPKVLIAADKTITFESTVIGYNFQSFNAAFLDCKAKRDNLAAKVKELTGCRNEFASPMCTCVRAFTSRVETWGSVLNYRPEGKMLLGEVLMGGVGRCMEVRRTHDVREPIDKSYARSSALLIFAVAILFNALYNLLLCFDFFTRPDSGMTKFYHLGFFVLYFGAILLFSLTDADGNGPEFSTVLTLTLPAFLVHGLYLGLLFEYFKSQLRSSSTPLLHPVTFDICFSALNLFTLTERGVVQTEYLWVELFKGHAVAAIYIAIVWYHRYGKDRELLSSEFVQQAYAALYGVGIVLSASNLVVPYPSKRTFELHWLLPVALTYVAFCSAGWAHSLRLSTKLNTPQGGYVHGYAALSGLLVLVVGAVLWGYFLAEHVQLYGVKNFAYPVQGDPQSYVVAKSLLLPLTGVTF
jgi:uncharacterized membrane protein YiaA